LKLRAKGWLDPKGTPFSDGETIVKASIETLAPLLAKLLKPTRKLVSVVKFSNGTMEELSGEVLPAATDEKKPKVATTVATPTKGCPAPDFASAELKAREVLEHFLSPEQMADFRRYNRFISAGGTTGHQYMITSRHARDQLAQFQRTLYDLDEGRPYCVHDWTVPAAEEMLALHLLVQLPGWERELRYLEE